MSDLAGRRILVTGANGFLGRHLVRRLAELGADVHAAVRGTTRAFADTAAPVSLLPLDLTDDAQVVYAVAAARPHVVFHLAAHIDLSREPDAARDLYAVNTAGTIRLANALLSAGPGLQRFVQVGSCEAYGDCEVPFVETQRERPVSAYGASKLAASRYVLSLHRSRAFPAVIVRPFLTYGPGQRRRSLVTAVIRAALRDEPLALTAGEQTRELNHVDDIVAGLIAAATTPGVEGEIVNLGCGEPLTVREIVERLMAWMPDSATTPEFGALPYRDGEVWRFHCDPSRARELLGWQAKVSLDDGLARTIAWYREHPEFLD